MFEGQLAELVLAAGALGVAAYGLVEAFKWTRIGAIGFGKVVRDVAAPFEVQLVSAYGSDYVRLLLAQYRNGRGKGDLPRTLRQGIRIGLTPDNAEGAARAIGGSLVSPDALRYATTVIAAGEGGELPAQVRATLARFELALDARIESAMGLAEGDYVGGARTLAMLASVALALAAAASIETAAHDARWLFGMTGETLVKALLVGIAAVPLGPVANDLAGALQAVTKSLRRKA